MTLLAHSSGRSRLFRPTHSASVEGRCVRQAGSLARYAKIRLELQPIADASEVVFDNCSRPELDSGGPYVGYLLPEFLQGTIDGLNDALRRFASLHDMDVSGLRIALTQMVIHPLDSNGHAFRLAASEALDRGLADLHKGG